MVYQTYDWSASSQILTECSVSGCKAYRERSEKTSKKTDADQGRLLELIRIDFENNYRGCHPAVAWNYPAFQALVNVITKVKWGLSHDVFELDWIETIRSEWYSAKIHSSDVIYPRCAKWLHQTNCHPELEDSDLEAPTSTPSAFVIMRNEIYWQFPGSTLVFIWT